VPRLNPPDPRDIPDEVSRFLTTLPSDPMFTTLSHSVTTIQPLLTLARALYTSLQLPARSREIAILTLADQAGSAFVWAQHTPISQAAGITGGARRAIQNRDYSSLPAEDRPVAEFAAAVATGPEVSDAVFNAVRAQLSERQVVELLHVLGYYWTLARFSTVIGLKPTQIYAAEYGTDWAPREWGAR
jgi:alkylhydroperoxidase family enzyme